MYMQVVKLYDLAAECVLTKIADFSRSLVHCTLAAVVVMSHGDELGNICGNDGNSTCTVQQVVDAFCQLELQSCTKVCLIY